MPDPKVEPVSRKDVLRIIRRDFPNENPEALLGILDEYADRERDRVQLAILKLSGGKVDDLLDLTKSAIQDYRDVLAWAEYDRVFRSGYFYGDKIIPEAIRQLEDADREEYRQWLRRE